MYLSQRQDSSSERVRRLQSDKDALQLQVQILTEQVNAQNDKLKDVEMTMNEKNLQLSNSEDLLNRVSLFMFIHAQLIIFSHCMFNGKTDLYLKYISITVPFVLYFRKCFRDHHWKLRSLS